MPGRRTGPVALLQLNSHKTRPLDWICGVTFKEFLMQISYELHQKTSMKRLSREQFTLLGIGLPGPHSGARSGEFARGQASGGHLPDPSCRKTHLSAGPPPAGGTVGVRCIVSRVVARSGVPDGPIPGYQD